MIVVDWPVVNLRRASFPPDHSFPLTSSRYVPSCFGTRIFAKEDGVRGAPTKTRTASVIPRASPAASHPGSSRGGGGGARPPSDSPPELVLSLSRERVCARSGRSSLSGPSSDGGGGRVTRTTRPSSPPPLPPSFSRPSPVEDFVSRTAGRTKVERGGRDGLVIPSPVPLAWEGGVSLPALPPGLHLDPDGHGARPSQTSDEVLSFDRRRSVTPTLNGASHSGPSRRWTLPLAVSKAFLARTCPPTRLPAPRSRVR